VSAFLFSALFVEFLELFGRIIRNSMIPYQQCNQCVLDTKDDPSITFDANGVCAYCHLWKLRENRFIRSAADGLAQLERITERIRADGRGKPYDCVAGVSGGVDSTYVMHWAKKLGLRPLVVHLDNGWNSELAVKNIEQIVSKLGFDLHTHVVRWEEFKDIHLSFIKASVVDIELPTDHAIYALLQHTAAKYGLRHILSGYNIATEGTLPSAWVWNKLDWLNIASIHKRFGSVPLKTFPHLSFWQAVRYQQINRIETVSILDYVDYRKEVAKETITRELGWRDYGGKHFESVFTRFYQGYILPTKFGIDKRKAHLSSLICAGQLTKIQALEALAKPIYEARQLDEDLTFVLKKLDVSKNTFETWMKEKPVSHLAYDSYLTSHYQWHEAFFRRVRPITKILKYFYRPVRPVEYS